jgi:hypothetical protein
MAAACRPAATLLPHQQLVAAVMEAPPPSPDAYVAMGPVDPSHYLGLREEQGDQQEEEEPTFFMDAVSIFILL